MSNTQTATYNKSNPKKMTSNKFLAAHPMQLTMSAKTQRKIEDSQLWSHYHNNNRPESIREKLIIRYAHLVNWVAGRFPHIQTADFDKEDLKGYGTIGLIEAIDRFDNTKNCTFETFASNRIRGAILDFLRSRDFLSRNSRERVKRYNKSIAELELKLSHSPNDQEIKQNLKIGDDELRTLKQESSAFIFSLDQQQSSNPDVDPLVDRMPADTANTEDYAESNILKKKLAEAVENLNDREKVIVSLYHQQKLTFKEIGTILDISESRASQLHQKSLQRLRLMMKDFVV
jgi:RNA polymerase sigma factor for flagellar operon FliA